MSSTAATSRVKQRRPRRTHNLGGCSTCRRRHVKCDQIRPHCTPCRNSGLECGGFPPNIRWASAPDTTPKRHQDGRTTRPKTYLNNDKSRPSPVTTNQSDVADIAGAPNEWANVGAFSVFDTSGASAAGTAPRRPPTAGDGSNYIFGPSSVQPMATFSSRSMSDLDSLLETENGLAWEDLFDPYSDFTTTAYHDQGYENSLSILAPMAEQAVNQGSVPGFSSNSPICPSSLLQPSMMQAIQAPPSFQEEITEAEVLEDAKVLLKHFKDIVVPQFAPLPMTSKSPWEILVLRAAVQALSDMTFLQSAGIKHANQANLFGVLACSAYHMMKTQSTTAAIPLVRGEQILQYASRRAKKHLQDSLKLETSGSHQAKYKDQLMAIFSLAAHATLCGNQNDARCYLIDAERLLRLRGLAKVEVSQRARLLHHVYTWLRIIGESTFVLRDYNNPAFISRIESSMTRTHQTDDMIPNSEHPDAQDTYSQLDDFLRVDQHEGDSESDPGASKEQEAGLRDIHLEDMRHWSKTLYVQIYGIPELWLSLVSQTTRLANVMDFDEQSQTQISRPLIASAQRKASRLEHKICSFAASHSSHLSEYPNHQGSAVTGTASPNSTSTNQAMLRAMSSALVIFFYRRIRKVHPWILQGHVNDVIDALKEFDQSLTRSALQGPGTPWPAFIAGCEAMSTASRDWLMLWMEKASKLSAFNGPTASQAVMREVWRRRDQTHKVTEPYIEGVGDKRKRAEMCTWVDVLMDSNTWLMLY